MNKELTPLEALRNLTQIAYGSSNDIDEKIKNYFEIIEKSLKALEIIKELFKLKISIYEEKDQRPFGRVFTICDDEKCIVYETYIKENIQKLKLLKEVVL